MVAVDTKPRPPGQNQNQEYPELPFTPEWGSLVRRARRERNWSQAQLATEAGVSQAMISYIESGESGSSKAVIPIKNALGIPLPDQYFEDELEQRWVESGRVLRRLNEPGFLGLLAAAEQMIAKNGPSEH